MNFNSNINSLVLHSSLLKSENNPQKSFRIRNVENKLRSPEFAFKTVYGLPPLINFRGSDHETKLWRGLHVDVNLKKEWLDELASIKEITIISSCAGHNADRLAYIVFKLPNKNKDYIINIVRKLKKIPNTYSDYTIGTKNSYRICVATKNWFKEKNNNKLEKWWSELADNIRRSL